MRFLVKFGSETMVLGFPLFPFFTFIHGVRNIKVSKLI